MHVSEGTCNMHGHARRTCEEACNGRTDKMDAYGQDGSYRIGGNVSQLNETVGTADEIRAEVAVKRTGHDFVVLRGLEALLCHVAIDGVR